MQYPIFNSIVNKIKTELQNRDIKTNHFKIWKDSTIFATGLETEIDISDNDCGISQIKMNFDWDQYRELKMAKQLKGMEKHPLLKKKKLITTRLEPTIDVEISWVFDNKQTSRSLKGATSDGRLEYASLWMKNINESLGNVLPTDKLISRWHLDVVTDAKGKYISTMCLITYMQYSLKDINDLNIIHNQISKRLHSILNKSIRVLDLVKKSKPAA
jgi:hypothetical protein